jgi:hypothetical protein
MRDSMPFDVELTVSFFSTHDEKVSKACNFPTAKHESKEITDHLNKSGAYSPSWTPLVKAKKIKSHVNCATVVNHDIPADNNDGFTKPKLNCDNVLLLAGDMPNF